MNFIMLQRRYRVIALCAFFIGGFAFTSSASANDLVAIYQQAVESDHQFKADIADSRATIEQKNIALAGLLPTIVGRATQTETATETNTADIRFVDFDSGNTINPIESTDTRYSVSLTQPLFNLSVWHNYKAGQTAKDIAEAQVQTAQQSLILRVASAYFEALEASDRLDNNVAEEEAFEQQLEQSRQRFEVGLSAITEVHESQASYDSAVARRLGAEGELGIAFEALEVLTGETYTSIAGIKEGFEAINPIPAERQQWVERALENNAALETARANAKASDQMAKSARAAHLPTLELSASYNDSESESNLVRNNGATDSEVIGFTLNVPIFTGGATSASRRQAKQQAIQARQTYLGQRRNVTQNARSNYLSVITSVATVRALKQAIVSNQSALEATQAGYSVGTRDLVDVLNAQRGLYQARQNYFNALYTYILNSLRLKETAGILNQDDLVQLNNWLDTSKPVMKSANLN